MQGKVSIFKCGFSIILRNSIKADYAKKERWQRDLKSDRGALIAELDLNYTIFRIDIKIKQFITYKTVYMRAYFYIFIYSVVQSN